LYDVRSNTLVNQRQQHSRFVQDIRWYGDQLYSIGNDNNLVRSNLSSFDRSGQIYELPYTAVGPFQATLNASVNETSIITPSMWRTSTPFATNNNFFPMSNVFNIDPYESDRLLTCSSSNARFYRLSMGDEDAKLDFPSKSNASLQHGDGSSPSSCVHWEKYRDICMIANVHGLIQLYRRVNRTET
jgi:hypothetical protein